MYEKFFKNKHGIIWWIFIGWWWAPFKIIIFSPFYIIGKIFSLFEGKKQKIYIHTIRGHFYFQEALKKAYEASGGQNKILKENLKIIHEKDNEFDPNALAIFYDGDKIGYIPREDNEALLKANIFNIELRTYIYKNEYSGEIKFDYYI